MRILVSACVGLLVLLASELASAQPGTNSSSQDGGRVVGEKEQLGTLPPVSLQLFNLKKKKAEAKAKREEAARKATAKREEYREELKQLTRQRQAEESAAEFAAWQRRQTPKVNKLRKESQRIDAQAGMAALRSNEADDRLKRFARQNGAVELPAWAEQKATNAPPLAPLRSADIPDELGEAYDQAEQARGFGDRGGVVFDTSRTRSEAPVVIQPDRRNDPLPSRPAPVRSQPIIESKSRERRILTDPGGVVIASTAYIEGLRPEDVDSASFDSANGLLTLALRSGKRITCKLDADDFTVAVRCVFDRDVDPALSMSFDDAQPGFFAVDYTGPLFKTQFGKRMYEIDQILGNIMFNREGDHRGPASAVVPAALVFEADLSTWIGSRVFLLGQAAYFVVEDDRLVCEQVDSRIQVSATDYAADYVQESLHRVARAMDEGFDTLVETFPEFQEFRRLTQYVGLAKWLKRHSIDFDWTELKTRAVAEHEFPAYVPSSQWSRLFNGRNLDGWQLDLSSGQFDAVSKDNHVNVTPTGPESLRIMTSTWTTGYDLRYVVRTEGPVELVVRDGKVGASASVVIDTKGQRHALEVFVRDGKWSVIGPDLERSGDVPISKPKDGEENITNEFGIRVPRGSTLALYAAAIRRW